MTDETHTSRGIRREMTYDEVTALLNGKTLAEVLADNSYASHDFQPPSAVTTGQTTPPPTTNNQVEMKMPGTQNNQVAPSEPHSSRPVSVPDPILATSETDGDMPHQKHRRGLTFVTPEILMPKDDLTHHIKVTEVSDTFDYRNQTLKPEEKRSTLISEQGLLHDEEAKQRAKSAPLSTQSKMLRGSLWMTLGNLFSRLLGALYIIPWTMMLGVTYSTSANGLYAQGYQIYSVALLIATAGLPNVLARLVAEYAAKKQFGRIKYIFRQSLILGGIMGVISALALYMLAGPLSQGNPNVVPVIRSLAAAVLVIPILSMLRGYVQGFEFMSISATSQVVEQFVRVVYMLGMTAWIMLGKHGNWVDATVQSTLAAFFGAMAGILVVLIGIARRKNYFDSQYVLTGINGTDDSVMWKMMRQALPVIFAGSAIALVQVIDQFTFFKIMNRATQYSSAIIDQMFAQFSFNSNKLVMLVVSLAVAMAETTLPMLSRAKALANPVEIGQQVSFALKLLAFVILPASLGMAAVAHPLYVVFYGTSDLQNGVLILQYASFVGIMFGLYMVVLAVYQGIGEIKFTVYLMGLILIIKLVLQYPLTVWFKGMGPLMATLMAFAICLVWSVWRLIKRYPANWHRLNYSMMLMLFWSLVTYLVVAPIVNTLNIFVNDSRMTQMIVLLIGVLIGGGIYGTAALKTHLGVEILGDRARRLAEKLPF
ncbi:polysaccharide biosynthesis protein [Weissella diestrammenae]|uniref:Polysaccharide biosynthesis protein n=1 Tax=Weissella diestrammenae TaxID=1162633 RepID=A0A7G9T6X4_9LACO|nr:polysaccharide biosynthesis protein [Weissella diestrammenae]MCM0582556.1 polysaccharide biosynthesis protein [Weissella diestrammenae]QNN75849.1 polysaccharide biosynthesis protein [Weissella diestrammenae]